MTRISRNDEYRQLAARGLTVRQAAEAMGVKNQSVYDAQERLGIKFRRGDRWAEPVKPEPSFSASPKAIARYIAKTRGTAPTGRLKARL